MPSAPGPQKTTRKSPATKRYEAKQLADAEKEAVRQPSWLSSSTDNSKNTSSSDAGSSQNQMSESERAKREEKRLRDHFGDLIL
jgi:hypothetical protein